MTKAGRRTTSRARRLAQLATKRARVLPSFLIIGAQRAGTTSLLATLRKHPDIVGPSHSEEFVLLGKEVHFFDKRYHDGINWYRSFFPLAARRELARRRGRDLVAGESTPYYLFHPDVPARVAATIPDVRLIALLRNPVDRAYSHYQHRVRAGREKLSFGAALEAEDTRLAGSDELIEVDRNYTRHHHHRAYFRRGLYAEQLERWFDHFPRKRLLIVRAEDYFSGPAEIHEEVLEFLGVRPWQFQKAAHKNNASYPPIEPAVRAKLEARYAAPNARLERLLGRDFGWSARLETRTAAGNAG
ncbi:MAG: sulfotransferase domain-containing protein [Gaiellaceae bacterium]